MGSDNARDLGSAAFGTRRVSAQRLAIVGVVDGGMGAFSAGDLIAEVRRAAPGVGPATVYRALAAMEESGFIEKVGTRDGAALYARCRHEGHHHHVVCTSCGAVADATCPIDVGAMSVGDFAISGHSLVLYGLCGGCRK